MIHRKACHFIHTGKPDADILSSWGYDEHVHLALHYERTYSNIRSSGGLSLGLWSGDSETLLASGVLNAQIPIQLLVRESVSSLELPTRALFLKQHCEILERICFVKTRRDATA